MTKSEADVHCTGKPWSAGKLTKTVSLSINEKRIVRNLDALISGNSKNARSEPSVA